MDPDFRQELINRVKYALSLSRESSEANSINAVLSTLLASLLIQREDIMAVYLKPFITQEMKIIQDELKRREDSDEMD